jgi:hypothetical protein
MPKAAEMTAAAMVSEARGLVAGGWCQGAHARNEAGVEVASWSEEACCWSLLGALLAGWHHQDSQDDGDLVAHLVDAHALGEATEILGDVVGTAALDRWNDDPARRQADVVAAFDRALAQLDGT